MERFFVAVATCSIVGVLIFTLHYFSGWFPTASGTEAFWIAFAGSAVAQLVAFAKSIKQ